MTKYNSETAKSVKLSDSVISELTTKCTKIENFELDLAYSGLSFPAVDALFKNSKKLRTFSLFNLNKLGPAVESVFRSAIHQVGKNITTLSFFTAYHVWDSFFHVIEGEVRGQDDHNNFFASSEIFPVRLREPTLSRLPIISRRNTKRSRKYFWKFSRRSPWGPLKLLISEIFRYRARYVP
jgi:hypothetical protein